MRGQVVGLAKRKRSLASFSLILAHLSPSLVFKLLHDSNSNEIVNTLKLFLNSIKKH